MKPERGISSNLLEQFDGFLNKPLDVALLLSELTRLTQTAPDIAPETAATLATNAVDDKSQSLLPKNPDLLDTKAPEASPLILIVEDNVTNQKITKKMLEKLGYSSLIAENGEEALQVLAQQRDDIALILMDCRMPVMDGLQATQAIRAKGDDIVIIALTANNSDEDKAACLAVGMNEFLSKPVNKAQLQAVLAKFLASENTANQE